jgi:hypothetical protein
MARKKSPAWQPVPGCMASYTGRTSRLLRGGREVQVVAEASGGRTVVKALGHAGEPVEFPVLTANLAQPQPFLFDE